MRSRRIPMIAKWWSTIVLAVALLSWAGTAGGAHSLNRELIEAAWRGDAAEVKSLLRKGADLNAKDLGGETILMYAARGGESGAGEAPHWQGTGH